MAEKVTDALATMKAELGRLTEELAHAQTQAAFFEQLRQASIRVVNYPQEVEARDDLARVLARFDVERPRYRLGVDRWVRERVLARDHYACRKCGATADLHLDHVIPWSKGGWNDADNLQILCASCNLKKGAK